MKDVAGWLRLFKCDESDLADNRRGVLSAKQLVEVRAATRSDRNFMIGFSVAAWIIMGGVFLIIATSPHKEVAAEWWLRILIFVLPVSATIWAVYTGWIHSRDPTKVEAHEGSLQKRSRRYRNAELLEVNVGDGWFPVSRPVFIELAQGDCLRLFVAKEPRVIVMIEPL